MAKSFSRVNRVAQNIKRELSYLLPEYVASQEYGLYSVSEVELSTDYSIAKVYVSLLDAKVQNKDKLVLSLNENAKALRKALADKMKMRTTPALSFVYDSSIEQGSKIMNLLDEINSTNKKNT